MNSRHVRGFSAAGMVLAVLVLGGCAARPATPAAGAQLRDDAQAALAAMIQRDPHIEALLERSAGYAIFPMVGKGGLIVGGAFGRGTVHQHGGEFLGYAKITQASVGGVVGGRASSLLLVFEHPSNLEEFKAGRRLRFGAEASAVALTEGASATTRFNDGVAVFALPRGGLMADASLSGQVFSFVSPDRQEPLPIESGDSTSTATTAPQR